MRALLKLSGLPFEHIDAHFAHFQVATDNVGAVHGSIGLESYGRIGLLRPLAVTFSERKPGYIVVPRAPFTWARARYSERGF